MYKKGTIVLVPFPFTDLSGSKVRPAIIISAPLKGDDVVVLFLSSQKGRFEIYDVALPATVQNRLKADSRVKCAKIATLDKKIILGELGVVEIDAQKKIDAKLKKLLLL